MGSHATELRRIARQLETNHKRGKLLEQQRDEAILRAREAGLPLRAIAAAAGISFQRVAQITRRSQGAADSR